MEDSAGDSADNSHAHLYKYKDSHKTSQHERRLQFLEQQKEKRHQETDKNRDVCDLYLKDIEESAELEHSEIDISAEIEEHSEIDISAEIEGQTEIDMTEHDESINAEEMEYEFSETETRKRKPPAFRLMITEWFLDIPDDLAENWLVKLCPEGFRLLLISRNRCTAFFTRKGRFIFKLKSYFPGGGSTVHGTTVLDCIYNKAAKMVFILDCLFWNSMPTLDSEADFRFYWLRTKFEEMPELSRSINSTITFILLPSFPAERALIQDKIVDTYKKKERELLYDGVVFYHKESQYTFGYTPLATWLSTYMLPDKLGIDVPEQYLAKKPEGYINLEHFIEHAKELCKKNKRKKKKDKTEETKGNTEEGKEKNEEVKEKTEEMEV